MFDKFKKIVKDSWESTKQVSKKAKDKTLAMVGLGVATVGATMGKAAVTYDETNNKLTGDIDLGPFYSGVGIAFAVIGAVLAVGLAISIVKRGK